MSEQQVARTAGAAALRGALLVGAAVLIGVLLLSKNDGILASAEGPEETVNVDPADGDSTDVGVIPDPTIPDSTPVTTPETTTTVADVVNLRDPSKVRIQVANGAFVDAGRVNGAAGKTRDRLVPLGYNVVGVSNWDDPQEKTAVYYLPGGGFQNDARSVARELGISQPQVLTSPGPATTSVLGDADVLVVLGADTEG